MATQASPEAGQNPAYRPAHRHHSDPEGLLCLLTWYFELSGIEFLAQGSHVLPGSLVERTVRCGKANCRCHAEPPELHGPYALTSSGATAARTGLSLKAYGWIDAD